MGKKTNLLAGVAIGVGLGLDTTLLVMREQGVELPKVRDRLAIIYEKAVGIPDIISEKARFLKDYNVAIVPTIKNQNELLRKLKASGFDQYKFVGKDKIFPL